MKLDWKQLLNESRRKPQKSDVEKEPEDKAIVTTASAFEDHRTQIERDYDRILFSTPVRRLADKTQVFPLERNDSVRTRLTHSHEVSNLARSVGVALAFKDRLLDDSLQPTRNVPSLLAAIGLVHDLGNPPFGHQGENAIRSWFRDNSKKVLQECGLTNAMEQDFLQFEGNAQTLRLVTRLQLRNDDYGLDLTYATLAALMKYPTSSDKTEKKNVSTKKFGFFQSEAGIVEDIWKETGLSLGQRHPLTFVMEACDDIAYCVLDAEDSVKKGLVSFSDLISYLDYHCDKDETTSAVIKDSKDDNARYRKEELSPAELNDVSMQKFRVHAIGAMIRDVRETFNRKLDQLMSGEVSQELIELSRSQKLRDLLKDFDKAHAYAHRSVLEVELQGYNTIRGLMDFLWEAINDRSEIEKLASKRNTPFASYAYRRISENYRRVCGSDRNQLPVRYRELQLLTDMISGMTDSYAISLFSELKQYHASTTS